VTRPNLIKLGYLTYFIKIFRLFPITLPIRELNGFIAGLMTLLILLCQTISLVYVKIFSIRELVIVITNRFTWYYLFLKFLREGVFFEFLGSFLFGTFLLDTCSCAIEAGGYLRSNKYQVGIDSAVIKDFTIYCLLATVF